MFFSNSLAVVAVAALANEAAALNAHRHGRQHLHRRDVVATNVVVVTNLVTVTDWIGGPPTTETASFVAETQPTDASPTTSVFSTPEVLSTSSTTPTPSSTPSSTASPTTLVTSALKPSSRTTSTTPAWTSSTSSAVVTPTTTAAALSTLQNAAVDYVASSSSSSSSYWSSTSTTQAAQSTAASATASSGSSSSSSSGGKRGLAFNDASLLSSFVGSGSKCSWAYNWGQTSTMDVDVEFVPMLWGTNSYHTTSWSSNAEKAIAAGSTALLSFNEPDNAGQANLSPAEAKAGHVQYMNPFKGKAKISAPAITNSGTDGQGISWLSAFLSACSGECAIDFVPIHWYNSPDADDFLSHIQAVHAAAPDYPIWITEFAPTGASSDEINSFLETVLEKLDSDTYSYVERYAYFMVAADNLVSSGTSLSTFGNTYAYSG